MVKFWSKCVSEKKLKLLIVEYVEQHIDDDVPVYCGQTGHGIVGYIFGLYGTGGISKHWIKDVVEKLGYKTVVVDDGFGGVYDYRVVRS